MCNPGGGALIFGFGRSVRPRSLNWGSSEWLVASEKGFLGTERLQK